MKLVDDGYGRSWIIENAKNVLAEYGEPVTVRQLYYRLVTMGMTNTLNHYQRVVQAMVKARWDGTVSFSAFTDRDRQVSGRTEIDETNVDDQISSAISSIETWMEFYAKNRWENQDYYIEVWIEKKALQGVFERPCRNNAVALFACKGYPSLTSVKEASYRIRSVSQEPIILYFGDYDPTGEDIPRSISDNLS